MDFSRIGGVHSSICNRVGCTNDEQRAHSSVRISVVRANEEEQIEEAAQQIADAAAQLRALRAWVRRGTTTSSLRKGSAMEPNTEQTEPRISVDPNVHFGKSCVAGTRIPVRDVLELLRAGHSFEEILTDDYPDLEEADVQACVQYAIDTIDAERIHVTPSSS